MKSPTSLLPHLAPFLVRAAVYRAGPNLLDACDRLSIDHKGGVLSGRCHGAGHPMLTSVDLDRCLGWIPRDGHPGLRGRTSGLVPVKDGGFTDYCSPCYIVNNKDEQNQGVVHLLCDCGLNNSATTPGYSFDLGSTVIVTDEGCLECMGVTGTCVREAPSSPILDISLDQGLGGILVESPELKSKRVPCEESVTNYEDLLPATYPGTTHNRCRQDHALCCYQTPARRSRVDTYFEAFKFIRGRNCIYRLHFVINRHSLEITGQLSRIVQFCDPVQISFGGECEGETQLDEIPDPPEDDTGLNFLEDSEHIVYGDDSSELEPEPTHVA